MEMLAGPAGRPQPETQLIREDLVQKISEPDQIGIVAKISGDPASTSNMANIGEDDGEQNCIPAGSARIVWLRSQETDEDVTDLCVLDRSFILGDIVAPLANPIGQTGILMEIGMSVDLELPSGEIVKGIDSRRLRRVRSYMPGDFVIGHGNWLGRIEEVMDNVTVVFEGGAKCKIFRADTERLIPVKSGLTDDTNSPYYPGQQVRGGTPGVFKSAKWLKGTWKATRTEGTVGNVEVGSVLVYWITSALTFSGTQPSTAPAMLQKPSALLPLMYLSLTNWQLGDWPLLPPGFDAVEYTSAAGDEGTSSDQLVQDHKPAGHCSPVGSDQDQETTAASTSLDKDVIAGTLSVHKQKLNKQQKKAARKERRALMKKERGAEHAALVVKTETKVDVLWQDGTKSFGTEASSLVPVEYLGDHEFWPEQYVLDRGSDGIDHLERRLGVVKSVNATQRTAVVRWLRHTETFENPPEFVSEENVSVYEIVEHPHFTYCLGDVVMRLTMNQPKVEPSEFSKESKEVIPPCSEHESEAAPDTETGAEQEIITSDDQHEAANDEDAEVPKKEKCPVRRRGWEGRSSRCNRPIVDLSWVGNVVELKDGEIQVLWADGNISKVGPADIFVVNNDDEEVTLEASELEVMFSDDALTWATPEFDDEVEAEPGQISLTLVLEETSVVAAQISNCNAREECKESKAVKLPIENMRAVQDAAPIKCSPRQYRVPLAAAYKKLVSRMAGALRNMKSQSSNSVFTQGALCCSNLDDVLDTHRTLERSSANKNAEQNLETMISSSNFDDNKIGYHCSIEPNHSAKAVCEDSSNLFKPSSRELLNDPDVGLYSLLSSDCGHHDNCNMKPPSKHEQVLEEIQEPHEHFKQFDSVRGAADHHFVNLAYPNLQKKWVKKIQAEWAMLKENLPESIYVRVYEDRMDLLRAAIVGAQGTPYHDSLFIFDFHLPQEFPLVPPVAYYHSGGLRLNPNLYENGNVCLSLLNTWKGKGTEVWDASNSSMLQLLVSIQGLVLNVAPYFNEAGYERQLGLPEGERNSLMYNENAFLLTCNSILYLLRRPPQHFESLVQKHFEQRGPLLLKACAAYMNGALVGSLDEDLQPKAGSSGFAQKSTVGFRIMLDKVLVKLTAEFAKLGGQSNWPSFESTRICRMATNA